MSYLLALLVCTASGTLLIRWLTQGRMPLYLGLFLGTALGFGLNGQIIFYLQLAGNNFNHFLPPLVSLAVLGLLIFLNLRIKAPLTFPKTLSLLVLAALAVPLWLEAHHYPLGGWDAWSCWNLKAKFIFFGEEHWKDMLQPNLWRSNTNYPLALPTINVWFWHWTGFSQAACMFNAIVLTLLTAGTLLLGLQELKVPVRHSILLTLAVFTLSLGNTFAISQYSDMLSSLYLLSALVCYLLYQQSKEKEQAWLILCAIFTGLLSFTKNEGLVAAGVITFLVLVLKPSRPLTFIIALGIAALPEVMFSLFMAPSNEAFVNGLTSAAKPSDLSRLGAIIAGFVKEIIGLQWSGLWILVIAGIIGTWKKAFSKPLLLIGLFVTLYLGAVLAYYHVNTFFEINWWIQNTLNRILFALMPAVFLWLGISAFGSLTKTNK